MHNDDTAADLLNQAFTLIRQGRLADAERPLARLCERHKDHAKAWFMRGAIRFEHGDMDLARDYLGTAIRLEPGNTQAHFTLCKIALSLGDLAAAIAHAERVVELDAAHGEAWLALSSFYTDAGLLARAEQAGRTAMTLLPDVVEAKVNVVNTLIAQGKRDQAIALCNDIRAQGPAQPGIWHSLGLAYQALGLIQDAAPCLEQVTRLDPNNAAALCTLGEIKAAQDDVSQAQQLYERSRQLAPAHPRAHFQLGKVLLPNSSARHRQRVRQLARDHRYRDADEALDMARELATDFRYGNAVAERALVRFFDAYDPACLYPADWWTDALRRFGDRRQAPDTALRSVYAAVFSWSLPCRQALDEIAAFAGKRLASYGSGAGYWEHLLATHYGIDVACHDMTLRHRFVPMRKLPHSEATLDPEDAIFLAWLPGEVAIDAAIESLLDQARPGQRLVLVGEPADENGHPRTCGTRRFFAYLQDHFETQATIPLPNYAYFKDRVELLVRK